MGSGLKQLSSKDVIAILALSGFVVYSQRGSHIKLRRYFDGQQQTLMIPERKQIAHGTLREIYKQASAYIPPHELHRFFYIK